MKTIQVEITGESPLLMNNPASMIEAATSKMRNRTESYDLEKEAAKLVYKMKSGELYIPAEAIKGSMIGAASYKKFGKFSARPIIAGGVFINPPEIGLGTKTYELDVRTVVINGSRVIKARPKIEKWKASFQIKYNPRLIGGGQPIKEILEEAGERVGLLDFRPQKLGNFGMFKVTKWVEE